ncbi:MAG: hypothetical protein JO257_08590 [Deltaproteobacteria bacterium]|nr:hypothetical protein [Deltaproteobacteria bacterium]
MKILLSLLLATSVAHADTELSLGSTDRALHSSSANALTDSSLIGGQATVAHLLLPNVWVTGSASIGGTSGTMLQMTTSVVQEAFQAGVRGRYPIAGPLSAIARADAGVSNTDLTLDNASYQTLTDHGWAPLASGALGFELAGRLNPGIEMGFRFELGYVACAPVELSAKTHPADDGTIRLPMSQASLGSLDLSGKYAAASWLVRF